MSKKRNAVISDAQRKRYKLELIKEHANRFGKQPLTADDVFIDKCIEEGRKPLDVVNDMVDA
jgi:hypothetical protein